MNTAPTARNCLAGSGRNSIDDFKEYSQDHRCHRHHIEGIEEVRQQWGDEAAIAGKIHILVDCWGIPSKSDYENGWVNWFRGSINFG